MTEPSASEQASLEAETLDSEKSEKVAIEDFELLEYNSKLDTVTTGLSEDVAFSIVTTLSGSAKTVWLGYRFVIPEKSPSGGTYSFGNGTYSRMQPLDGQGQITVKKENGNLILEGKALAQQAGGDIAPGMYVPTLTVHAANLVNGETVKLKGECWLLEGEGTSKSAEATMTAQGTSDYAEKLHDLVVRISGYFNKTTGDFSLYKPGSEEGYTYGRNRIYATNEEGMVVAEITYSETGEGVCTIEHVEVDEALRGQGIAGKLVEAAVAEIKVQNKKVATTCPYVRKLIDIYVEIEPLFEEQVDFETFSKSDFRVVKVKECIAVKKSKKLLQFTLDDGTGTDRTILSGIHMFYEPEELVGKTLVAITNLPPRVMMGIESCGMLLSAVYNDVNGEEKLHLVMVDDQIPAGAKLY